MCRVSCYAEEISLTEDLQDHNNLLLCRQIVIHSGWKHKYPNYCHLFSVSTKSTESINLIHVVVRLKDKKRTPFNRYILIERNVTC